ncbi:MAG: preprotein translocase subunit SecE [Chloroflexota bacterium]
MAEKDKKGNILSGPQSLVREMVGELRKVTWPTRPEANRLTILVLIVMTVVGLLLALVQEFAALLVKVLLG